MNHAHLVRFGLAGIILTALFLPSATVKSDPTYTAGLPATIAQTPLYMKDAVPPLNMLVMGKDHKIYYEAYNDASDLNGDGTLDVGYKPAKIDYYGYFNSYVCYQFSGTVQAGGSGGKFVPASKTANKQCSGAWSGDFLNYLTTSRMDALRRVLYGGWRKVDTASETVLQGAFIPQDGHSWGKEYQSVSRDGYNISNYAPLSAPPTGKYHLFAVTTLKGVNNTFATGYQQPLLRVLKNTDKRVWNWLSIETPVAGEKCFTAANTRVDCAGGGTAQPHPGHPSSRGTFDSLETTYALSAYQFGTGTVANINCTNSACNPFGADDNYLTIIAGQFHVGNGNGNQGYYQFSVDGDDAVDFEITQTNGNSIAGGQAGFYNGHDVCNCNTYSTGAIYMDRDNDYRIRFRHEDAAGGDQYILRMRYRATLLSSWSAWSVVPGGSGNGNTGLRNLSITTYNLSPTTGVATRDDYDIRVQVCPAGNADLRDSTCKAYPNGGTTVYKPTGILHDYGDSQKMYFGLITGSQRNNLEGGVLRRNISNFANEVDASTGIFRSDVTGITSTIDRLRMIGGGYNNSVTDNTGGDTGWNWANGFGNCVSQGDHPLPNGECRMWGNPLAEMLYESMRYFAGAAAGTPRFAVDQGGSSKGAEEEAAMGLSTETWKDPYAPTASGGGGYPTCARPYQTIISDINPSYDGDLPGSGFTDTLQTKGVTPAGISAFSASDEGQEIWNNEPINGRRVFIGDVGGVTDGAPTAKSASSFGNIRGLSPEEPSKGGTYYSASVARFGRDEKNDINAAIGKQHLSTYSIALASPLPRIEFPVNGKTITLIPFAKTASGTFGGGSVKPTNTIVDFYVEEIANFSGPSGQDYNAARNEGRPYAVFRINYEDVEQGNDHDMDAIVRYLVQANAAGTVTVTLSSEYAAGSADQNMGYVMSGTTNDGVYLEVRDSDSTAGTFRPYDLNTPNPLLPGACKGVTSGPCNAQLPLTSTRTFTPSSSGSNAVQLQNPLWYAAKYGSPSYPTWDADGDGTPDNYFLVTNPLNLRTQLSKAFEDIANRDLAVGAASISGARVGSSSFTLQPTFRRARNSKDWTGNLSAVAVDPRTGALGSSILWSAQAALPPSTGAKTAVTRTIWTIATTGDGTSNRTGVKPVDFKANNDFGATNNDRLSKLGITPGTIPSIYGANYTSADFIAYLRGDQSREASVGGASNTLRTRSSTMGDIVNSEPVISTGASNFGYSSFSASMFFRYDEFLTTKKARKTVAFVNSNDGMLHAFDASTQPCPAPNQSIACAGSSAGTELFAFVPNAVLSSMGGLTVPDSVYQHRYLLDGQIGIGDAKNSRGDWKTVLVSAGGGGARTVFALDVTDPDSTLSTTKILWERNSVVDRDIGNIYGKPLVVPLEDGSWGVLFGNGYGGNTSDPSLYILNATTGELIKKITADDGNPASTSIVAGILCSLTDLLNLGACAKSTDPFNGLGQITAIDKDGNGKIDTVYGGDLQGNLWKFNLSATDSSTWAVANGGAALLNAEIGAERQPITGGIRVAAGPGTGVMVYFGTGRYFATGDNDVPVAPLAPQVQSLYGVFDNGTSAGTRASLTAQSITSQVTADGFTTRKIDSRAVAYYGTGASRGWYIDLAVDGTGGAQTKLGERFIATPQVQSGRIFFTTYTPSESSCDPGGTNYQYVLDLLTGGGALSNVGVLTTGTTACKDGACGAVQLGDGTAQPPVVGTGIAAINPLTFANPTCATNPSAPGCAGGPTFEECQVVIYPGALVLPRPCGRQSWRQLK